MWLSFWKQLLRRSFGPARTARRRPTFRKGYRPLLELLEDRTVPSMTFTVTTTADSTGAGTLRTAILSANANLGLDAINFNIPGAGAQLIGLLTPLPTIGDPVMIDGTTQPSFPFVILDGTNAGTSVGLTLGAGSGGSTVKGLLID